MPNASFLAGEIADIHAAMGCNCCGRKLNPKTMVWLEVSFRTGKRYKPGECPEDESQGAFAYGAACARRVLREQRELRA